MLEKYVKKGTEFHHSALFLDFLDGNDRLKKYLYQDSPAAVAAQLETGGVDRDALCDILEKQNEDFDSKPAAFEAIKKLRSKNALCIFTGQQAGLFGGPLLTMYKAIDIVKRAEKLEKELNRPVIPVFWIACDDHDFEEVNHTFYINREGEPARLAYTPDGKHTIPVADICLGDKEKYDKLREESEQAFGGTDFSEELGQRLFDAYAYDECLVRAFARNLADTLPDLGMVFFCPHNTKVKTLSKNFFKQLVERHFQLRDSMEETGQKILNDGYHIQADKKKTAVHLFYHFPGRTPIHYLDDNFAMGEKRLGLPAILDLIDRYPERFSPDVLTRPVWQSFLFPVVAHTGGPSEIAYFCQIGETFRLLKIPQPFYYSRIGATLVEKRQEDFLDKYNIRLADLTGDIEQLINRLLSGSFPESLENDIHAFRENTEIQYLAFAKKIHDFDQNLEPMAKQTWGKIDFALNNFEKKIFAQHKKKMDNTRKQIYRLVNALYPNRTLQERSININYYISKYGYGIVNYIIDKLDIKNGDHQMIHLSEIKT